MKWPVLNFRKSSNAKPGKMGTYSRAPAQRLADFVSGETSGSLPVVSYFPGVTSSPLHSWLPKAIGRRLRDGFRLFGQVMKGYFTNEAVVLGLSRGLLLLSGSRVIPKDFITSGLQVCTPAEKDPDIQAELFLPQLME